MRCDLKWECPVCGTRKRGENAELLMKVVDAWRRRGGGVYLATFTVAHAMGDDLKGLAEGITTAFSDLFKGRAGMRFKKTTGGGLHVVRSLEVTRGPNGWHPHIHVLFLTSQVMNEEEVLIAADWLYERWADMVVKRLGEAHMPAPDVGTDFRESHKAEYLAKLGLEIADPGLKEGRNGSRTPLQILRAWVEHGDERDLQLYKQYVAGMKGRRFLTWSMKGAFAELKKQMEEELEAERKAQPERMPCAVVYGPDWDELRKVDEVGVTLLEAAERRGTAGVIEMIARLLGDGPARRTRKFTEQYWQDAKAEVNATSTDAVGPPPPLIPQRKAPPQLPLPLPKALHLRLWT